MNESRHPIDDLFKDGLEHYQLEPPMHVWDRIDQKRTPVYKLTNNFKQNYRWYLSVLAGLAVMSSAAIMLLSDGNNGNIPVNAQGSRELATLQNTPLPSQSEEPVHVVNPTDMPVKESQPNAYREASTQAAYTTPSNSTSANSSTTESNTQNQYTTGTASTGNPLTPIETPKTAELNSADTKANNAFADAAQEESPATVEAILPLEGTPTDQATATETAPAITLPEGIETVSEVAAPAQATETEEAAGSTEQKANPPYVASKWSIDVMGGYSFTSRVLQGNTDYATMREGMSQMNGGYSFMLRAGYNINSKLSLRSGIAFTKLNENFDFMQPYKVSEIQNRQVTGYVLDPISGPQQVTYTVQDTIQRTEHQEVKGKNSFSFLDIPVFANYTVFGNKFMNVYASAGVYVNLRFAQGGHLLHRDGQSLIDLEGAANPYNVRANIDLGFGAGLAIKPWTTAPVEFLLEPSLRLGTGSLLNSNFGAQQNFRTLNTYVGIRYRF